jgi:hypothetical protein
LYSGRCKEELIYYFAKISIFVNSVSNPGCLFRIPDPDFYPYRIQKQQQKRRGEIATPSFVCSHKYHNTETIIALPFDCSHKYHNIETIYF